MSVETVSKFIEWAAKFSDGQYLFRGVSTESYKIEASAYRRLPEIDRNNTSKLLKINQELIEKARGLGHDQKNGQQLSDLELLAELQHFGAATCLIDFSRSALVALWFACQQGSKVEANGKVFAVCHDDMVRLKTVNPKLIKKEIDYFFKPDENGRFPLYQWQPKLQNNRIIAQQSVFVFSGASIEAEDECVIKRNSKQDILISLDNISDINVIFILILMGLLDYMPTTKHTLNRMLKTICNVELKLNKMATWMMLLSTTLKSYGWIRQTLPQFQWLVTVVALLTSKRERQTSPLRIITS